MHSTQSEHRASRTTAVMTRQRRVALKAFMKSAIDNFEIAYEPVGAIGAGHNATSERIF
jgi:triosephosphate isomerase